ncbi:MerR family transcriptional regulator [Paenibacillus lycopersici]|uniref:MerR family transcriptional regulator n=1 Tax=Paenibacillus lycopersici TaxID=2704462 RepID=A0A6C0G2X4_9BACL|nr:MerR family transcriptional regulator [Paenibacillus lycopersici]QHT60950.1 MerR family transcriptional regulator [Paenibacillus lycopersici]
MSLKVKEAAALIGVSIRTLHHYNEIGLLMPETVNAAGHRLYSDRELERLQQILFFRELGFSLEEIKNILDRPDFDRYRALVVHRDLLLQKKRRLEEIIETVDRTIQFAAGGMPMNAHEMFEGFTGGNFTKQKKKYTAGGYEHTLAIKADGTAWGWGNFGEGSGGAVAAPVQLLSDVKMVAGASGHYHSFAVRSDGTVWGWGSNSHGQLGSGGKDREYVEKPIPVAGIDAVEAVSAGVFHALALRTDRSVWSWGQNWYGQLGDGTTAQRSEPAMVSGMTDVLEVAAGFFHSMALKADGTVWRWGGFGDSTPAFPILNESLAPVRLDALAHIAFIAAGGSHGVALQDDGSVWTWGYNNEGQLGDGTVMNGSSPEPRKVPGLTNVAAIAAGGAFTLALRTDGTVWSWGANSFGELGDGTNERRSVPAPIGKLADVVHIAAGTKHAMAMTKDGRFWVWGSNDHGQLGERDVEARNRPHEPYRA